MITDGEKFYVFVRSDGRGWRLRHGNLRDETHAREFAEEMRVSGLEACVKRQTTITLA